MRSCKRMAVTGLALLFVLASLWVPSTTDAGRMFRLSMEFGAFASGEIVTTSAVLPGDIFYSKTVMVPVIGDDTATFLYVSVHGSVEVFDTGGDVGFGCFLDGAACTPETGPEIPSDGMIPILEAPTIDDTSVEHAVSYTWCVGPVPSGSHTVELTIATTAVVTGAALDSVHVSIDAGRISQGTCSAASF